MNMFSKNPEFKHSQDKSGQHAVLAMPERTPRPEPVRQPAPLSVKPSIVDKGSAPLSVTSSLISEGFEFTGDIKSAGSLTVDGAIKGNLVVQTLLIGAKGLVDGSVKADSINVEGCLSGAIECKDLVVGSRAVVDGKLSYNTITIRRGGTIKGDLIRE
ncbi:MAG: polymer-forming cytoskeletal protein [Betaproteobacteria bacterium]|nr:polymer-forming cytoskeletal protein [Betaproteobacteria bacterium]